MKRRQEAAKAEERAKREKEEAERLAALAAAQPREIEEVTTDRPDSTSPAVEERAGKSKEFFSVFNLVKVLVKWYIH